MPQMTHFEKLYQQGHIQMDKVPQICTMSFLQYTIIFYF